MLVASLDMFDEVYKCGNKQSERYESQDGGDRVRDDDRKDDDHESERAGRGHI